MLGIQFRNTEEIVTKLQPRFEAEIRAFLKRNRIRDGDFGVLVEPYRIPVLVPSLTQVVNLLGISPVEETAAALRIRFTGESDCWACHLICPSMVVLSSLYTLRQPEAMQLMERVIQEVKEAHRAVIIGNDKTPIIHRRNKFMRTMDEMVNRRSPVANRFAARLADPDKRIKFSYEILSVTPEDGLVTIENVTRICGDFVGGKPDKLEILEIINILVSVGLLLPLDANDLGLMSVTQVLAEGAWHYIGELRQEERQQLVRQMEELLRKKDAAESRRVDALKAVGIVDREILSLESAIAELQGEIDKADQA